MSHPVTEVRTQHQFLDISCLQSLLQSVPPGLQQSDLPLQGQNLGLTLISRPLLGLVLLPGVLGLRLVVMQPLIILLCSVSVRLLCSLLDIAVPSTLYLDPIFQSIHNFCSHVLSQP